MNKNTGIIIGFIVLVVIVGGVYVLKNNKDTVMIEKEKMEQQAIEDQKMAEEKIMMDKKATEDKDAMIKDGSTETDSMVKEETSKTDTMVKVGSYEAYSQDKIAMAATGDVVLFFHASWCPSCRGLNSDIEKNISAIPGGVTILKTDYDTQTELKKKYGVTYQHTLVQVDKDGNLIKKWSGSSSLSKLLAQVQ